MRILILGGTGFVGPHAVRRLIESGNEVFAFHRGATPLNLSGAAEVFGDLADFEQHAAELRKIEPEVVIDMIPYREEHGRRVRAFAGIARRAVILSSGDVYRAYGRLCGTEPGEPHPIPLTEDAPLRERLSPAGLDYNKTGVEREAAADPRLPVTILRLPAIHGPGDRQHRLFPYLKRMDDGRPAILLHEGFAGFCWSRGYVEDMGHAVFLAATREEGTGRTYNVADGHAYPEAEWVRRLAQVAGWTGEVISAPCAALPENLRQEGDFRHSLVLDTTRIRTELGYHETVLEEESLRRTLAWERENPPDWQPDQFDYVAEDLALATSVRGRQSLSPV